MNHDGFITVFLGPVFSVPPCMSRDMTALVKMPNFTLSSYCENRLAPTRTTTPYLRTAPIWITLFRVSLLNNTMFSVQPLTKFIIFEQNIAAIKKIFFIL